jgi:hypothetical protein
MYLFNRHCGDSEEVLAFKEFPVLKYKKNKKLTYEDISTIKR